MFLCHFEVVDVIVSCVLLGFSCDFEVLQMLLWFSVFDCFFLDLVLGCVFLTDCMTVWPCCLRDCEKSKIAAVKGCFGPLCVPDRVLGCA